MNFTKISVKTKFIKISVISTEIYWNLLEFTEIYWNSQFLNPVELETTGIFKSYWKVRKFLAPSQLEANWNFQPSSLVFQ